MAVFVARYTADEFRGGTKGAPSSRSSESAAQVVKSWYPGDESNVRPAP